MNRVSGSRTATRQMPPVRDEPDPWQAEADAAEFAASDHDVAFSALLPAELAHHGAIADADPAFEAEFFDWLESLSEDTVVLLVLEQCCAEGVLLPPEMRGARIMSAPWDAVARLDLFLSAASAHVIAHMALTVFWLVRAERARRRGTPDWSPRAEPPAVVEERAFFRPSRVRFRHYGG